MKDTLKSAIKRFFSFTGFQIQRVQPLKDENAEGLLNFGPYTIKMPARILLSYNVAPNSNQFLGRLAGTLDDSDDTVGIIDVGANCGDTAALMRTYTKIPIFCIEGDPELNVLLTKNVSQCPDITVYKAYVGESTGPISVTISEEGLNNALIPTTNASSIIEVTRLDDLKHPWFSERKIGLLKVDTEGFDVRILHGAKKLLEASKPIISFEYNRTSMDQIGESGLRVFPYLESLGYQDLMVYDNYGRYFMTTAVTNIDLLTELDRFIRRPKQGVYYLDIIAFPKSAAALFEKFRKAEIFEG